MFGTLQDRLIKKLAQLGIGDIDAANQWLRKVYLPRHNRRFARPAAVAQSAFVAVPERAALIEELCIQEERVVERDNTVTWRKLKLQLPDSPLRHHGVKARVRIHHYPDDTLALFHGPACIARYDARGRPQGAIDGRARPSSRPRPAALTHATLDRPRLPDPTRGLSPEADK